MCDYKLFLQSPMEDSWNDICKNGRFGHKFQMHVGWYGQDSLQVFCPRTRNTNGKEHEHKPYKFEIDMHVEHQHHAQIKCNY